MKEQLEQDLKKYQELQRVNEINAHRLDALITYIQEKLAEEQVKAAKPKARKTKEKKDG